jgi:HlyD family type I secretion membrane fusion protein
MSAEVLDQGMATPLAESNGPPAPSDSIRGPLIAGATVAALFFGGLGTWAVTAPLNAAVVGDGQVKVEGNRKSVQNLDGGIVKSVRVREGERVAKGDVLVVLDDSTLKSQFDGLAKQQVMLEATEARLVAEQTSAGRIMFPPQLLDDRDTPYAATAMASQEREFNARKAALSGQENVLRQRIAQLQAEIAGAQSLLAGYRAELASATAERDSFAQLAGQQLVARSRLFEIERTASGLEGQIGNTEATIAKDGKSIAEMEAQIAGLHTDRDARIAQDLRDTRLKLVDVGPRLESVRASLQRLVIRAPYAGKIVDLAVFSTGAVITPGEKILDIVPSGTPLTVEAHVGVADINVLKAGIPAEVRFPSFDPRTLPLIHGRVTMVSADRLTDTRTGAPYFLVDVDVDRDDLAANRQIQLRPGMPATVVVTTEARTALDYLAGPLIRSFDHAFRQR